MGTRTLALLVLLIGPGAQAQKSAAPPTPQPSGFETLFAKAAAAEETLTKLLTSTRPASELQSDTTLFSERFTLHADQRGTRWVEFGKLGKPVDPAAFSVGCEISLNELAVQEVGKRVFGSADQQCAVPAQCRADFTRVSGCYSVKATVCVSPDNAARIDKLTDLQVYFDHIGPLKMNVPCQQETERRAKKKN